MNTWSFRWALEASQGNAHQDLSDASMERLMFGARLARVTQLPILVTGGASDKTSAKYISKAELMSWVLQAELHLQARLLESDSNTTQENAKLSAGMLKQEGIQTIYLVTHFWHMPRAKAIFEKEGLKVVGAPSMKNKPSRRWIFIRALKGFSGRDGYFMKFWVASGTG